MSNVWALSLGIIFWAVWVCVMLYLNVLWRAYMLGQTDFIQKKNRRTHYTGLACWSYRQGRAAKALQRHSEMKRIT